MGSSVSKTHQTSEQDVENVYNILLLGALLRLRIPQVAFKTIPLFAGGTCSGKTTVIKQMKIMYKEDFSETELAEYRPIVYSNVLFSVQQVCSYMRESGLEWAECSNKVCSFV